MRSSKISSIALIAEQCRRTGAINLAQGAADFVRNDLFAMRLSQDDVHLAASYTNPRGTLALRQALSRYLSRLKVFPAPSEDELCITPGATGAFAATILACTEAGDQVLVHEPFWDYHVDLLRAIGREPIIVRSRNGHYDLAPAEAHLASGAKVRAVVVVSPGNPSGEIVSRESVLALLRAGERSQATVILDEVYSEYIWSKPANLLYDHNTARTTSRLVLCHSLSKSACITGWRLGFAVSSSKVASEIARCNGLLTACAPAPLQTAAATLVETLPELTVSYRDIVRRSKTIIKEAFSSAGFEVHEPDGGFFFLATFRGSAEYGGRLIRDRLLVAKKIGVVEADGFFDAPQPNMIRVCFAVPVAVALQVEAAITGFSMQGDEPPGLEFNGTS